MLSRKDFLTGYDGPPVRLMEVCGTHTAAISHSGIAGMLPPAIRLISGPGCPVCVTVTSYLDRLAALSLEPNHVVVSFGDLLRVKGSDGSLQDAKARGGQVRMVYSPMDMLPLAAAEPHKTFVFAAVGFETTEPVYALLLSEALRLGLRNVRLLTSLKTMPAVIDWVCTHQGGIDGFLAPGHVSVITGVAPFVPLAERYGIPFVIAGFEPPQLIDALYALVKLRGRGVVKNLYPSVVAERGNETARQLVSRFFEPCDAAWRGMGVLPESGMRLRAEWGAFDAGSAELTEDGGLHPGCRCASVLVGEITPSACPLYGTACTPQSPQGACMVSQEGSCYQYYSNKR
ncbi:MAG: hydrogenase formation protein HypD [Clostridium sp. SCN 57-10]|nr:MAG: hydrogenase formation protein HypD [Clostridium sp. SCN 57-10]